MGKHHRQTVFESIFAVTDQSDDFSEEVHEAEFSFLHNAANTLLTQLDSEFTNIEFRQRMEEEVSQSLQSWNLALGLPAAERTNALNNKHLFRLEVIRSGFRLEIIRSLRRVIDQFSWICSGCATRNAPIDESNPFKVTDRCTCCNNVRSGPLGKMWIFQIREESC